MHREPLNHPRLTAALLHRGRAGCAAAPAVFLAAADAASLGRVETVADPYVAPDAHGGRLLYPAPAGRPQPERRD